MSIVPAVSGCKPARARSRVDFPQPLGPSNSMAPPYGRLTEKPETIGTPPAVLQPKSRHLNTAIGLGSQPLC